MRRALFLGSVGQSAEFPFKPVEHFFGVHQRFILHSFLAEAAKLANLLFAQRALIGPIPQRIADDLAVQGRSAGGLSKGSGPSCSKHTTGRGESRQRFAQPMAGGAAEDDQVDEAVGAETVGTMHRRYAW